MSALFNQPISIEPGGQVELIDGREIPKPWPKKLHAFTQAFLIRWLGNNLPQAYFAASELNVLTGVRTQEGRLEYVIPDVTVVRRDANYLDGDLAEPPIFAVEILSPRQTISYLFLRSERVLQLGSPLTWVIWPERRRAWSHSRDDLREASDSLAAPLSDDVLLAVNLADLWAVLE